MDAKDGVEAYRGELKGEALPDFLVCVLLIADRGSYSGGFRRQEEAASVKEPLRKRVA